MKAKLEDILGKENVTDDSEVLKRYSRDQSFVGSVTPQWVVFPKEVEQVQEVVKLANQEKVPITPFSSGLNFHGAAIPDQGGIILNMSKMNKVIEINEKDRWAIIEPGVTYGQFQDELAKHGFRFMLPFGIPPQRTVLSSQLERDPSLAGAHFNYGNELIIDIEIVLPEGAVFKTVGWMEGGRPVGTLNHQHRLWTGAQGTFGIVTKGAVKIEPLPVKTKLFFLPFETFDKAVNTIDKIQWRAVGLECILLNDFNLAAILTDDWAIPSNFPCGRKPSGEFTEIRKKLSPWTGIICITAFSSYFPEEKIAYEEEALREVCAKEKMEPLLTLNGTKKIDAMFSEEILRPWSVLKKFNYKGSIHDVAFKSPRKRMNDFLDIILKTSQKYKYPGEEIGGYILPIERARYFHCEFDFSCDLSNEEEAARIKALWLETSEALIDAGAFFDRPYGPWAEMVFSRAGVYTQKLKELKKAFDPNNIMNAGKLCFC
jgi:FAD/FMN-containing dehydrogenase